MFRTINMLKISLSKKFSTTANAVTSKLPNIVIPNVPLHEMIWQNLDKWSDKTAIVCANTNRSYTYHQIYQRSLVLTKFLRESLSLQNQETVAIILPNSPEFPIVLCGAIQAGLKVTTCNPNYTPNEIYTQLINSDAKVIFTCHQLLPVIKKSLENLKRRVNIVSVKHENNGTSEGVIDLNEVTLGTAGRPVSVKLDDVALLPYSSGTTGLPKGVELTHKNLVSNICQSNITEFRVFQETTNQHQDIVPGVMPMFHSYGLIVLLYSLMLGAKTVTVSKFGTEIFSKLLKQHSPTVFYAVPSIVLLMINNSNIKAKYLSSIRTIISAAGPLGATDLERFAEKIDEKINLYQLYGLTETSPVITVHTKYLEGGYKEGGIGLLVPNTETRVVPLDGDLDQHLGPNQSGELLFRGPQIMKGYFRNPKANNDVFLEDGWFRSGDVGYYDEDEHFYITDRLKELIKVKSFQVAPAELEAILRHHPRVEDCAIVGVPHAMLGEAPKAFVVLKSGHSVGKSELEEFVAKQVSKYKHLAGGISFIDEVPRNPSGKILRKELRKIQ